MRNSDWLKIKLRLIFLICVQAQILCNGAYIISRHCACITFIGVRDQFRLGGLRSVARIFYPLLARKSSGLPEYYMIFFWGAKF